MTKRKKIMVETMATIAIWGGYTGAIYWSIASTNKGINGGITGCVICIGFLVALYFNLLVDYLVNKKKE